jgi:GNAT superfamily N-acetyltransferase
MSGDLTLRAATAADWPAIWAFMRPIVEAGETFSWDRDFGEDRARAAWMVDPPGATFVAQDGSGRIVGTAEMSPNHGGGGAHIANAGFMVDGEHAGRGVGHALGEHVVQRARVAGFAGLQFNAVVATNVRAVALWQRLGCEIVATIPGGFRHPRLGPVGLHIMYRGL